MWASGLVLMGIGCAFHDNPMLACPAGVVGQSMACMCGGLTDTATCLATPQLDPCVCADAGVPGTGGTSGTGGVAGSGGSMGGAAGNLGTAGTGGATDSTGGTDGGRAATSDQDGGPGGGTGGSVAPPPATHGNQLAPCSGAVDCNTALDCYSPASDTATGYCSQACSMDSDCPSGGPAYTCEAAAGTGASKLCAIDCSGTGDTSCPSGMGCVAVAGGDGNNLGYRCMYPGSDRDAGSGNGDKSAEWESCMTAADCNANLYCAGTSTGTSGVGTCVRSCTSSSDCTRSPSSGNVTPSCVASVLGASGGPAMICGLDCTNDMNGCPDGMTCAWWGGLGSYCFYM